MNNSNIYIFIDDILRDYKNHYGEKGESILIEEFKKYLEDLSKNSKIMIITCQNIVKINNWFLENNLSSFIEDISNPTI